MVKQQPDKYQYHFQHLSTSFTTGEWSALKPQKPHQTMRKDHRWSDNILTWQYIDTAWMEHDGTAVSTFTKHLDTTLSRTYYWNGGMRLAQMRLVAMSWSVSSTFSDWRAQIILAHSNNGETAARQVSLSTSFTTGEWSALKPQKPHQTMRKDHRWSDNILTRHGWNMMEQPWALSPSI